MRAVEVALPALGPSVSEVRPRLLDLQAAGRYLGGLSTWTVRSLIEAGVLRRVHVPLPGHGELRRVLLDIQDLDRLVSAWKDGGEAGGKRADG
jgi:hypothetical protein